jgi:hypothetical protein
VFPFTPAPQNQLAQFFNGVPVTVEHPAQDACFCDA